jgi:hypothetical protein
MKSRKEYMILAAVLVVLVLYLVFYQSGRSFYQLPDMPDLSNKEIIRIEITTPQKTIELKKEAGQWLIYPQGFAASESKVDKMIDTIKNFKLTALVSESENYSRYQLAEDKRITVSAWAEGDQILAFSIGKAAPSHRHTFVKLPDNPNVYHAETNFRSSFDQSLSELRDKTVLAFKREEIQAIEINHKDKKLKILRSQIKPEAPISQDESGSAQKEAEKPVWQDTEGNGVEKSDVAKLLNTLSDLECTAFIDDHEKQEFTEPVYKVTLNGPQTHSLSIFAKANEDDNTYPATSSGSRYPFNLSARKAETIMEAVGKAK